MSLMNIQSYIEERQLRIEGVLKSVLKVKESSRLASAMSYAVLNGGKRLRPILAYASAEAIGGNHESADIPGAAIELIHAYSLIHDDLPAMDDDALRRGKPTCHIVYDDATAILAGDALQALAFELLADSPRLAVGNGTRLKMLARVSKAIGWQGMVGGQSLDFSAAGTHMTETELAQMHGLKTGALISASVQLGALSTGVASPQQLACLEEYASCIGLAFQVRDDILDVESDTQTLGKQQGRDELLNKPTYTSMLGLEGARQKSHSLCEQGIAALDKLGGAAEPLIEIAHYVVGRNH